MSRIPLLRHLLRRGQPWTRADLLTAFGLVIALAAVIVPTVLARRGNQVATSGVEQARRANELAASAQSARSDPKVSAVAAYLVDTISGKAGEGTNVE
ncbi:hypothetical protein [Paractinoplanes atraurantiacus]|uniref:Uncharacterized protein n=1 Tax=Paractinoplanes atraurantiacus TaxID=1036182 RepID=A0A285J467_9ACTN|nr:hypothetical protein [Actinoplanes atraurantiacus]SNY55074.1 hypothetical protein SAMN05421748_11626 [Actinoplanes atraurantiacus]